MGVAHCRKLQWFGHTTRRPGSLEHYVMHGMVEQGSMVWWSRDPWYGGAGIHGMVEQGSMVWWSRDPWYGGAGIHGMVEQGSIWKMMSVARTVCLFEI